MHYPRHDVRVFRVEISIDSFVPLRPDVALELRIRVRSLCVG